MKSTKPSSNPALDERGGRPSASGAEAYERCPAKFRLEAGLEDKASEAAARGDRIHLWLEDDTKVKLDKEELAIAKSCEDQRLSLLSLLFENWQDQPVTDLREQRLWFTKKRYSGKADFIALRDKTALIADYKTGRNPVGAAEHNRQLLWLAVLLAEHYAVDEVFVAIIQPLCGPYSLHRYDAASLKKGRRAVTKTLRAVESEASQPKAGEVQCRYCKAKAVCPALNKAAVEIARPLDLTPALVTRQLDVVLALEDWCGAVKAKAKEMLAADAKSIPGYHLRPGAIRRSIKDNVSAWAALDKSGLLDGNDILNCATLSLSAIEKHLITADGLSRSDAKRQINSALAGLIEEKQGEPQLTGGSNA